jgi:hypothetical protein
MASLTRRELLIAGSAMWRRGTWITREPNQREQNSN